PPPLPSRFRACTSYSALYHLSSFFPHPLLLSFPTRRSSDLLVPLLRNRHADLLFARYRRACRRTLDRHPRGSGDAENLRRRKQRDRKSTRLNSSHQIISYAVFCLKKKTMECCIWMCNYGGEE